jgi:hypothetical protein
MELVRHPDRERHRETTEAVLWEWMNAFSDASTRAVALRHPA